MNTATGPARTGTWEDAAARTLPVPIPPGETGTGRPGDGGLPAPAPPRRRAPGPCTATVSRPVARGVRRALPGTAPRRGRAVEPHPRHPSPEECVELARVGWAAVAATAVITAAVVVLFLALAHLRAPEPPARVPLPSGIPAAAVPPGETGGPGSR